MKKLSSIEEAIEFSTLGKHTEALKIFTTLQNENQLETSQHYMEAAFASDRAGQEHDAIPLYIRALAGDITAQEKLHVYFCLASSYRVIGETMMAQTTLEQAIKTYPDEANFQILQALLEYEYGNTAKSISQFLNIVEKHISQENLEPYKWLLRRKAKALYE